MSQPPATPSPSPSATLPRREIVAACRLLLSAFHYAHETDIDPWQFAVEIGELQGKGASLADLRWLVLAGLAEHRCEITVAGDKLRSFRTLTPTDFPRSTVLMLTQPGAARLTEILPRDRKRSRPRPNCRTSQAERMDAESVLELTDSPKPNWDQRRRELRYGNQLIKHFRVPAPNQETILQAFQEEGWPTCIDDPLPPQKGVTTKGRLQATIKSLNHGHQAKLIKFHGNGNGIQVYWETVS